MNADPRRMMPTSASISGTWSWMLSRANASGNAVKSSTTTRISQT
jgi:hypothetical protein